MTVQRGTAVPAFTIRAPDNRTWMLLVLMGGGYLALAYLNLTGSRPGPAWGFVALGCCYVPLVWAIRTFGVDLTRESLVVRGFRRRRVPWPEVQAVVSHGTSDGASSVSLVLENGESMNLPYPRTLWRLGSREYERDVQRIEEFWRAHRGQSWSPVGSERPVHTEGAERPDLPLAG